MVGFHPLAITRLLVSYNTNKTLKTVKKLYKNQNYVLRQLPPKFCPKEHLNRSRNPITS